jgi:DNA-binding transcriptional ArsR family regulator
MLIQKRRAWSRSGLPGRQRRGAVCRATGKDLVRRYIAQMTGLRRAQVTRLITAYRKNGRVKAAAYQRTKFVTRYTAADVNLLAYVDKAHGNFSGPAYPARAGALMQDEPEAETCYHLRRFRMLGLIISMDDGENQNLEQIRAR